MTLRLQDNMVGVIAYKLTVDGQNIETIEADDPIEYLHGADNIVPGLETALTNKQAGDHFSITLQPADGYGDYDEELIEEMAASDFDDFDELEVGMEIEMLDEDGDIFDAVIVELKPDAVVVDFNPALAGKVLTYEVQVVDVRKATTDEIEMGYPASLIDELFENIEDEDEHDHQH